MPWAIEARSGCDRFTADRCGAVAVRQRLGPDRDGINAIGHGFIAQRNRFNSHRHRRLADRGCAQGGRLGKMAQGRGPFRIGDRAPAESCCAGPHGKGFATNRGGRVSDGARGCCAGIVAAEGNRIDTVGDGTAANRNRTVAPAIGTDTAFQSVEGIISSTRYAIRSWIGVARCGRVGPGRAGEGNRARGHRHHHGPAEKFDMF